MSNTNNTMRPTPQHIKEILAQQGYGGIRKAIHASYWDMYKAGYNSKEMLMALRQEFGTEDVYIRQTIQHYFS